MFSNLLIICRVLYKLNEKGGKNYQGIGVSAGKIEGAARCIYNPTEGLALKQGEIMIAPSLIQLGHHFLFMQRVSFWKQVATLHMVRLLPENMVFPP